MVINSETKHTISNLIRIYTGIVLLFSLFLPMGLYFFHEGDTSAHPLYGFFVSTSYLCVVIGVIMILYNKLPFTNNVPFTKFLYMAALSILIFEWTINLFLLNASDTIIFLSDLGWIPYGEDLEIEFYSGFIFYTIVSFTLLSLRWFIISKRKSAFYALVVSQFLFSLSIVYYLDIFYLYHTDKIWW